LVSFEYTWNKINWEFEKLEELLKIMMMYKKKTLWKIQKILQKQWKKFDLPEELLNKRMHELSWEEIEKIEF
jgi:16S rRNA A1518/A1519 N6-dimethyltransferase RsmA/KsgA/DIM1 with predicted DNA glycosylase/AP lyase activity